MNCAKVQDRLVAYTENGVPITDELGIDVHLIQCGSCKEELAEIHELSATLRVEAMSVEVAPQFSIVHQRIEAQAYVVAPRRRYAAFRFGLAPAAAALAITCLAAVMSFSTAPSRPDSSTLFGAEFDAHIRESFAPNLLRFENQADTLSPGIFDVFDTSFTKKSSLPSV